MNDDMNNIPQWNEEKRKPRKGLIIGIVAAVLALVAALVLIITGTSGISGSSDATEEMELEPLEWVSVGFNNSVAAIAKNPMVALSNDVINGGSVEVFADLKTIMKLVMGYSVGSGKVSAKLYTDMEAQRAALEVQGLPVDLGAYLSENAIAVASEALLGEGAYGIGLDNVMENFVSSEFGPNGAYSLGVELPEVGQMDQEQLEELAKSTVSMAQGAAKQTIQSFEGNAQISMEDDTLSFDSEEIEVTAVTIEMDDEQMLAFSTELIQYVAEDEGFRQWLQTCLEIAAESSGVDSTEVEEVIDSFYEEVEKAKEQLEELKDEQEELDTSFKAVFYVTKSDKQLIGMDVALEEDGEKLKVSVIAGPDWSNLSQISIRISDTYGEDLRIEYHVETNDKKEFLAKLEVTANDEDLAEGEIRLDKETGEFELEIGDGDDDIYIIGTAVLSDGKFELFLQEIGVGKETIKLNATIILSASDSMPDMPKYKDILTMSAEELAPLMEAIEALL